jgi:hypothetical protein
LKSSYAQAQFAFASLLFGIAQMGYDTAVPDLIESNKTLRVLLEETAAALPSIEGDDAAAALTRLAALPPADTSLKLSALRAENDALREAFVAITPLIEPAADDARLAPLAGLRTRIYDALSADARRRIVPILSA